MTSVLGWMDNPASHTGISFRSNGEWRRSSYEQIATAALSVAGGLTEVGVQRGDVVTIVLPAGPGFAAAFFGVLAAGATPSPLAPPALFAGSGAYISHAARLLRIAAPCAVVTEPASATLLTEVRQHAGGDFPVVTLEDAGAAARPARRPPADVALLQFTSGSSGDPKAVLIRRESLDTQVTGIAGWLGMRPDDVTATWLPAHHDMGLIGCLLTPAATGTSVLSLTPAEFIRAPSLWLECFGRLGATLTATPAFGLAHALRQLDRQPAVADGWDLSRWRVVIVGAERAEASLLRRFAETLRPQRFDPRAYCPAYGLAESSLAVTGVPPAEPVRWVTVPAGHAATAGRPRPLDDITRSAQGQLVGSGFPLAGAEVRIIGPDGAVQPDGQVGEIAVRGPCVGSGYRTAEGLRPVADSDGWLQTGDAGLRHSGELYVLGRMGDALKVRGRSVFAEEIEEQVAAQTGIARHRIAALLGSVGTADWAILLIEKAGNPSWDDVMAVLRRLVGTDVRVRLLTGPAGSIARTSSGKPRRRLMWRSLSMPQPPDGVTEVSPATAMAGTRQERAQ
jgi:acyl-CoA synthetase (AMP-forming)/AMP-acid ligase II